MISESSYVTPLNSDTSDYLTIAPMRGKGAPKERGNKSV